MVADLSSFFASILGGPVGASPGLGTGPSALGRPSPGPVQPSAGGEGIRSLMANMSGPLFQGLFNQQQFPQLFPNTPSPFPDPPNRVLGPNVPGGPVLGGGDGGSGGGGGGGGDTGGGGSGIPPGGVDESEAEAFFISRMGQENYDAHVRDQQLRRQAQELQRIRHGFGYLNPNERGG